MSNPMLQVCNESNMPTRSTNPSKMSWNLRSGLIQFVLVVVYILLLWFSLCLS